MAVVLILLVINVVVFAVLWKLGEMAHPTLSDGNARRGNDKAKRLKS